MLRLNLHCECSVLDLIQPINELLDSYVIDFLVNVNVNLLRVYPSSDDDEQEEESHGREEGESDDEASPPPAGNTEGEGLRLSKTELRDARGW